MTEAAIKALRADLDEKVTDTFAVGDVIRWTGGGRYTYAAIKTSGGWYTTARGYDGNGMVEKIYEYADLVEYLAKSDVTDISVATEWVAL